ncbi:hypothetical protein CHS0354_027914 [Potamilus streckersoni]|uniref:Uncharacterized protein n=1 Tax=Potamilus streckersoni TaxID=2493646 RepID=A0AAE0T3M0_9BIVA|nr:hypothetical protein CHS0354_027914 [Potamilus streckersoni]
MYNKPKNKLIPSREPTTEGGGEHIVFRPTQITGDFPMKRYTQPQPDFPVGHLAEKIPIHYRSSRKQIIPIASTCAQDVHAPSSAPVTPDLMAGDGVGPEHGGGGSGVGESGGQNSSNSLFSSQAQKAPAFLPGWCWVVFAFLAFLPAL